MDYANQFRLYLLQDKTRHSKLTVKNYLADVKKFIAWFENRFHRNFIPRLITPSLVEEYKTVIEHKNMCLGCRVNQNLSFYLKVG